MGSNELLFTGTYEHTIDSKLRLAIPAEIREQLDEPRDGSCFYVCIGEGPTLCLYTQAAFTKRAEQLDDSEVDAEEVLEYERALFSLARRVEMDKQGRVRLPERLLKIADPGSRVVLVGVKDHLEIHNRDRWDDYEARLLKNLPDMLRNPRKVIRRKRRDA